MAGNALVNYGTSPIQDRKAYAADLAMAGDMLPNGLKGIVKDANGNNVQAIVPGKVLLVIETGRMLGIDPMAAIQGINVIEGKASISPALMIAVMRKAGHKIEVKLVGTVGGGDIQATAILTRGDDGSVWEETWDIDRAMRAGLVDSYNPDPATGRYKVVALGGKDHDIPKPWQNYTENLLRHRAVGDVCKFGGTDALMGVHYTPEELGAEISEEGTIEPMSVGDFVSAEDDAIERAKALTDKADMRRLYHALQEEQIWTPRVETAFTAHLVTLTVDSDPKKQGAPGNTGIPLVDAKTETRAPEAEPGRPAVVIVSAPTATPEQSTGLTEAQSEPPADEWNPEDPPADTYPAEEHRGEISIEQSDNAERAEIIRDADGMIPPGAALAAERRPFNPGALDR